MNEVVIIDAVRTPIGVLGGGLAAVRPDDLAAHVLRELLLRTGANNLLCDFTADFDEWAALCAQHQRSFRRNLSPRLLETASPDEIYATARRELARGRTLPGFIMGTAVIPFGTPTANILAVKQACLDCAQA